MTAASGIEPDGGEAVGDAWTVAALWLMRAIVDSPSSKSAPPRRTKTLLPVETTRLVKLVKPLLKASFQSSDGSLPAPLAAHRAAEA